MSLGARDAANSSIGVAFVFGALIVGVLGLRWVSAIAQPQEPWSFEWLGTTTPTTDPSSPPSTPTTGPTTTAAPRALDLDGDGRPDLAVLNDTIVTLPPPPADNNGFAIWLSFAGTVTAAVIGAGALVAVTRLNRDSESELRAMNERVSAMERSLQPLASHALESAESVGSNGDNETAAERVHRSRRRVPSVLSG